MLEWIAPYLHAIAEGSTHSEACRAAGCTLGAPYARAKTDPDFAAALAEAKEASADLLEREARRRAIEGVEEPVVYQGQLTPVWEVDDNGERVMVQRPSGQYDDDGEPIMEWGPRQARNPDGSLKWLTVRKPSDALLALLLKGRRPEVFGTERTQLSGPNGGPIETAEIAGDANKRAARLAALVRLAEERKKLAEDQAGYDINDMV